MKTINSRRCTGSSLLSVMVIIFVLTAVVGVLAAAGLHRTYMAHLLADRARALAIAEAGAADAFALLQDDFVQRTNTAAFPPTAYGGGEYDVYVTPVGAFLAIIASTGVCGRAEEVVVVDAKYSPHGTEGWDELVQSFSMLCGGHNTYRGDGGMVLSNGTMRIHANGGVDVRGSVQTDVEISSATRIAIGNNILINGDVTAPDLKYNASKVSITGSASEEPVPPVAIPDVDLTPYYLWAESNGEVHNGFSLSGGTYDANGGVIWVNGDVQLSSDTVINGTLIATGNINLKGSATVTGSDYGFSLVSRDGSIDHQSNGDLYGMVYARTGSYKQTGNGAVKGQIIVKGDIDKGGTAEGYVHEGEVTTMPGDPTFAETVAVSAWQK